MHTNVPLFSEQDSISSLMQVLQQLSLLGFYELGLFPNLAGFFFLSVQCVNMLILSRFEAFFGHTAVLQQTTLMLISKDQLDISKFSFSFSVTELFRSLLHT